MNNPNCIPYCIHERTDITIDDCEQCYYFDVSGPECIRKAPFELGFMLGKEEGLSAITGHEFDDINDVENGGIEMTTKSRIDNSSCPYQGDVKKVLCVCSAGLLRSPTAAWVLSNEPFNFNTRSAGIDSTIALIPVDSVLLDWADEIVCMTVAHYERLRNLTDKPVIFLDIPDKYCYKDPELIDLITVRYTANAGVEECNKLQEGC